MQFEKRTGSKEPSGSSRRIVGNEIKSKVSTINGVLGAALLDIESGQCVSVWDPGRVGIVRVARRHAAACQEQRRALSEIGLQDSLTELQLFLKHQCHLISFLPEAETPGLCLLIIIDRSRADIYEAHRQLSELAASYVFTDTEWDHLAAIRSLLSLTSIPVETESVVSHGERRFRFRFLPDTSDV